jgi:DNA-binding GntR family transcriptional regulator
LSRDYHEDVEQRTVEDFGPAPAASKIATIHEQITSALRKAVLSGEYAPGDPLRQNELAKRFGVSPVPIREALRALEQDGLVASVPRRGWVVTRLTDEDIDEIYELRELLEQKALAEAIPRLDDDRISKLQGLALRLTSSTDIEQHLQARERFYQVLYEASGKPRLVSMILALHDQLAPYLRRQRVDHSNEAHLQLTEALVARDLPAASRIV